MDRTIILSGLAVSPGIADGPAILHRRSALAVSKAQVGDAAAEKTRLARALGLAREELRSLVKATANSLGSDEAAIFAAQEMFLDDPALLEPTWAGIASGHGSPRAWWQSVQQAAARLRALGEEPWASRAADLDDVGRRVLRHLLGERADGSAGEVAGGIVLANDLTASEALTWGHRSAAGFALVSGSPLSHAAILARALGTPMVVGLGRDLMRTPEGAPVMLDGNEGQLILWPKIESSDIGMRRIPKAVPAEGVHQPAITRDGREIQVMANIGSVAEAKRANELGADGVGLVRTEFLYLGKTEVPDEEEQMAIYTDIVESLAGRPVTIRTLDMGVDKAMPALGLPLACSSSPGLRGIRASLARPAILLCQLRAILRAAARFSTGGHSPLRVMFPVVSTIEEWRSARRLVDVALSQLATGGNGAVRVPIGMMIEVPSAALMVDAFAQEADFFSVGTNDLLQYLMAADRENVQLTPLSSGLQPALLRMLDMIVRVAHVAGKRVSLCGELAGDMEVVPLLVGLGMDALSMAVTAIPAAKERIRGISAAGARRLATGCLSCVSVAEVRELIKTMR